MTLTWRDAWKTTRHVDTNTAQLDERVIANCRICDSPLSRHDDTVKRYAVGRIVDVITADGLIVVEFGESIALCTPNELWYA